MSALLLLPVPVFLQKQLSTGLHKPTVRVCLSTNSTDTLCKLTIRVCISTNSTQIILGICTRNSTMFLQSVRHYIKFALLCTDPTHAILCFVHTKYYKVLHDLYITSWHKPVSLCMKINPSCFCFYQNNWFSTKNKGNNIIILRGIKLPQ